MDEALREKTEALIRAIWGPVPQTAGPGPADGDRRHQNRALADAIRAYLQSYLDDLQPSTRD